MASALVSSVNFGFRQLNKKGEMQAAWLFYTVLQHGRAEYSVRAATSVCLQQPGCFSSEEQVTCQARPSVLTYTFMEEGQTSQSLSLQMATNQGAASSSLAGVRETLELWVLQNG